MSLSEAVKDIADELDLESESFASDIDKKVVKMFVKQIRTALKASEREKVVIGANDVGTMPSDIFSSNAKKVMEKQVALQAEEAKLAAIREEQGAGTMTELVGGSADGTLVPADPKMPVGAFTLIGQEVYQMYEDRKLRFSEDMTNKRRQGK